MLDLFIKVDFKNSGYESVDCLRTETSGGEVTSVWTGFMWLRMGTSGGQVMSVWTGFMWLRMGTSGGQVLSV
jgi:hypothetical protein